MLILSLEMERRPQVNGKDPSDFFVFLFALAS